MSPLNLSRNDMPFVSAVWTGLYFIFVPLGWSTWASAVCFSKSVHDISSRIFCSKKVFSSFQDSSGHSRATDLDAQQQVPEARTCLANAALRETQLLKGCIVVDGPGWSNLSVATIYHAIGHA